MLLPFQPIVSFSSQIAEVTQQICLLPMKLSLLSYSNQNDTASYSVLVVVLSISNDLPDRQECLNPSLQGCLGLTG